MKSGFCMCEHHACYHDDVPESNNSNTLKASVGRPAGDVVTSDGSTTVQNTPLRQHHLARIQERDEIEGQEDMRQLSTLPDTAQWTRFVHSGPPSDMSLPAIPSQCLLPSETGSIISYGGSSYLKPFGGIGSGALSHIPTPGAVARTQTQAPMDTNAQTEPERQIEVYEDAHGHGSLQSPTEVATPSPRASVEPPQDLGQNIAGVREALDKYAEARADTEIALRPGTKAESVREKRSGSHSLVLHNPDDENLLPRIKHVMGQLMDYPNKIQNHEHRLEQLENVNASFSNGELVDLRDEHDRVEIRVGELEDRIGEMDHLINDSSVCGRKHVSSVCGDSVTSSAMIASAMDRVDPARVEALEAQVAELQAAAQPSYSRPWEIEVVILPFGPQLMGIWSSQFGTSQRSRLGSTMTDEWTQTQQSLVAVQKALASHDHTSAWEKSTTDPADSAGKPWLMAKACALGSRVDERLRSRGLVKMVEVCGTEARDVHAAVMKAFGDLPEILKEDPYTLHDENAGSIPHPLKPYFGLSNLWIPLRKMHKDSCLRYLNPSEMVTPAIWTSSFLSSSVVMRHAKVRRLFVTHRDSYIQHLGRDLTDWTWQKLRQLPRVYPDQPSFSHTPEADAHEPCWEYDERLDPPHESFHSSISSHISQLSIQAPSPAADEFGLEPASPSDHFSSAAVSRQASTTPTSVAPTGYPTSPLKERKERDPFRARPMSVRTASMPSLVHVPVKSPHLSNKRRITSSGKESDEFVPVQTGHERTASSSTHLKRRRTQSPGREQQAVPNQPITNTAYRASAGPPSPYTYVDEIGREVVREGKGKEREMDRGMDRGLTPFAYATPHSNAPYFEGRERSGAPDTISVYEDESVAGDENYDFGAATSDVEAEIGLEVSFYGMSRSRDFEEQGEEEDREGEEGEEGSIDLDEGSNWQMRDGEEEQERQVEDEWEGVGDDEEEDDIGQPIGDVVDPDYIPIHEDDDNESDTSDVPSEYPSTQDQHQNVFWRGLSVDGGRALDGHAGRGPANGRRSGGSAGSGFMIHVDADEDEDEEGDDELV